ncbi:MAG TPA: DUF72 domain-containing protein [Gemmatimonadales bacterium]|nr:DUF72 domain-containing protein [Gemmatimonadales bacterium]
MAPRVERRPVHVGTAGWSVPAPHAEHFPVVGSHLERYALALPAVEINTAFYRDHRRATYERWAATVPAEFRFAVKVPRRLTHEARLGAPPAELHAFLDGVEGLGGKLGVLLVQLPPSLALDERVAWRFLEALRARWPGGTACEPRHPSWFTPAGQRLLEEFHVARVAADPAVVPEAGEPGGWPGLRYWRLHGSPAMYHSAYDAAFLAALAERLRRETPAADVWCIFDNTAEFHAAVNALALHALLAGGDGPADRL